MGCNCKRCQEYHQKVINGKKHNFNKLGAILDKIKHYEPKPRR